VQKRSGPLTVRQQFVSSLRISGSPTGGTRDAHFFARYDDVAAIGYDHAKEVLAGLTDEKRTLFQ
jgi:hypothetical protein